MVRIEVKNYDELSAKTLRSLQSLTLGEANDSHMLSILQDLKAINETRFRRYHKFFLAYGDESLLGWALRTSFGSKTEKQIDVFVLPEFRRLGIGTKLIARARSRLKGVKLIGDPWDEVGKKFYESVDVRNFD